MLLTGQGSTGEERALSREVARTLALAAGFAEAGVTAVPHGAEARDAERFEEWVRAGKAGTMHYLKRTEAETENTGGRLLRSRVGIAFPWARSAIVCFANYQTAQPRSIDPAEKGAGWIARYAWSSRRDKDGVQRPSDYHKVLKKRLQALEARLHWELGEFEARGFVDTGPVVERAMATAAGIGWTGKNTCLIHPRLGSFGFLAVLLTSLPVEAGKRAYGLAGPLRELHALPGACPTGALIAPYQMDARALHRLPDHRASGGDRARIDGRNGEAGIRLRHLPGCLPVEPEGADRNRCRSDAARRTRKPRPGMAGGIG